jgi:CxxC motif-containing protein (DUF1111 family)/chitodextrinase
MSNTPISNLALSQQSPLLQIRNIGIAFLFACAALLSAQRADAAQGISVSGGVATMWWDDGGWTGTWNYMCFGTSCIAGTKVGAKYQRTVTEQSITVGSSYNIQIKVQDNVLSQYVSALVSVVAASATADTTAPTVPTSLASPAKTTTTVNLTWSVSTDAVGVTKYDVYRGTTLMGSPTATSYSATGLTANTAYDFKVRACDAAGNCSAQTAALNVTTSAPDTTAPTLPTALASPSKTSVSVNLTWTASTDAVGVTKYDVYKGTTLVASPLLNSYVATGLTANTAYAFKVRACDAAGNCSAQTAALSATTNTAPTYTELYPTDSNVGGITTSCTGPNGAALCTSGSNRGTRRHDDSGFAPTLDTNGNPDTPDATNYHFEYWTGRKWNYVVYDYVANGQSMVDIEVDILTPNNNNGDPVQSRATLKCFEDYGTITDFHAIPQFGVANADERFVELAPNNLTKWRYTFTKYKGEDLIGLPTPGALDDDPSPTGRAFAAGDVMDCELTVRWQELVDSAESSGANYYSLPFVYKVGTGLVGYNMDPYNGPRVTSNNSMLGGTGTSHVILDRERSRNYMQPVTNMQPENMATFLAGRRAFRTDLRNGSHFDPESTAAGAQPIYTALNLNKASSFITENACGRCHLNDGKSRNANTVGFVPPAVYGVGLLEAINASTIASWETTQSSAHGVSGRMNILGDGSVGRFGYRATAKNIATQINTALAGEMGNPTIPAAVLTELTRYNQLLAVPSARHADITTHAGFTQFNTLGCSDCHISAAITTGRHPLKELRGQTIRPFTDLLLHNMADTGTDEFRTTPLWGIGLNGQVYSTSSCQPFMAAATTGNKNGNQGNAQTRLDSCRVDTDYTFWHDGSCQGANAFDCAILKHGGEGAYSRTQYNAASAAVKTDLINFLKVL